MAETMVAPNNKGPVKNIGGKPTKGVVQKPRRQGAVGKAAAQPSEEISGMKSKAKSMLSKGLISQGQHDKLIAKADKVTTALGESDTL